jgi:hypothetical protein
MNATRMTIELPDPGLAQALLRRWSDLPGVSLSILRGRVSAERARFDLEVRGSAARVARVVRQGSSWTVVS